MISLPVVEIMRLRPACFICSFQKFTGYSEQGMYVSSFLLMWIGFLLPFSEYGWKDWKKIAFYVVLVYVALFSLYTYGVKSLYVDVPTAAWAGGLSRVVD